MSDADDSSRLGGMLVTRLLVLLVLVVGVKIVGAVAGEGTPAGSVESSESAELQPAVTEVRGTSTAAVEARAAMATFEGQFPAGFVFPDVDLLLQEMFLAGGTGPVQLGAGFGETFVLLGWQCAWQQELVQALDAGSPSRVDAAAAEMARMYGFAVTQRWYEDPERRWIATVDAALDGRTSDLESAVEDCVSYLEPIELASPV
ncbi:hypothetical protein [Aeromicrobium sp. Sec7.5]|uniref:hypothetical protein n=1 Tax=Aeromicrobium sp. Sec7.5 TaxID=3121276 RepID=UPI002FE4EF90